MKREKSAAGIQRLPVDKGKKCDIIRKESKNAMRKRGSFGGLKRAGEGASPAAASGGPATSERTAMSRTVLPPLPGA